MALKKLLLVALLLVASASVARATGQQPDVLKYGGKTHRLFSNPLEAYYSGGKDRPNFMVKPHSFSSGNWRGYVATWEIVGGKLYLSGIDSWFCDRYVESRPNEGCRRATLRDLFGRRVANGKVLASWFSGKLRVPDGKQLAYVHMGYGSVYERDIYIEFRAGKEIRREIVDNTKRAQPSNEELQRRELEKLKNSTVGDKPAFRKPNL